MKYTRDQGRYRAAIRAHRAAGKSMVKYVEIQHEGQGGVTSGTVLMKPKAGATEFDDPFTYIARLKTPE